MKTRESGMPSEEMWQAFLDPEVILKKLDMTPECGDVLDFGCGYCRRLGRAARKGSQTATCSLDGTELRFLQHHP